MNAAPDRKWPVPGVDECHRFPKLIVNVLNTSDRETSAALRSASALAHGLNADIRLLFFQVVPYPLDLHRPDVPPSYRIGSAAASLRNLHAEVQIQVFCCRDIPEVLGHTLPPESLILVGREKRWWRRRGSKLIRLLRSRGHHAVIVETR